MKLYYISSLLLVFILLLGILFSVSLRSSHIMTPSVCCGSSVIVGDGPTSFPVLSRIKRDPTGNMTRSQRIEAMAINLPVSIFFNL